MMMMINNDDLLLTHVMMMMKKRSKIKLNVWLMREREREGDEIIRVINTRLGGSFSSSSRGWSTKFGVIAG